MNTIHRTFIRIAWISCAIVVSAAAARAETQVRVTVDRSTIWTADFQTPAAVVDSGTRLTVVAERKDWYEVLVPETTDPARAAQHGFIFKSFVTKSTVAAPRAETDPSRFFGVVAFASYRSGSVPPGSLAWYQSRHHSKVLPCMSCSPQALAG